MQYAFIIEEDSKVVLTHCMLGFKIAALKLICNFLKNVKFDNIFWNKYSAGDKRAGAKIRAHLGGP